jgi:Cysteine rich repeat
LNPGFTAHETLMFPSKPSKGISMKNNWKLVATLAVLPSLAVLDPALAQSSVGKTLLDKLNARVEKLETACAQDIKKYCRTVTPGEGRMIYCMQAHEDKISAKCIFELEDTANAILAAAEALKGGVIACKAEITGVCGKVKPGEGRIATCLLENKSTASTPCADAIAKVQSMASDKEK